MRNSVLPLGIVIYSRCLHHSGMLATDGMTHQHKGVVELTEEDRQAFVDLASRAERLRWVLEYLTDQDCSYVGSEVRIQFASHGDAIEAMSQARRALEA